MTALVVAEAPQLTADLVRRAEALGTDVLVVALPSAERDPSADVVLVGAGERPEDAVPAVAALARERAADLVLLAATVPGREIAARLAMRLGVALVAEATAVELVGSGGRADRVVHGGSAVQTVAWDGPAVVTVAPRPLASPAPRPGGAVAREAELDTRVARTSWEPRPRGDVDLASADRVVCVGMGVRAAGDLALVDELAAALDAQVACTRPVAEDRGWLPPERYVGISGLRIGPRLYVGVGVSGQVQHAVGMRESQVVVAVNSDERAPAVQDADHAVVGDLYQVVPALTAALRRRTASR